MSYGGLHPSKASIHFLFFYVGILIFLFNIPLLYYLMRHFTTFQPKEKLLVEIVFFFLKLGIAAYFIEIL